MFQEKIQEKNSESLNNKSHKIEKKEDDIPKKEILKRYGNYDLFLKTINSDPLVSSKMKENLFSILQKISDKDLEGYIDINMLGSNLIDAESISRFIEEFEEKYIKGREIENSSINSSSNHNIPTNALNSEADYKQRELEITQKIKEQRGMLEEMGKTKEMREQEKELKEKGIRLLEKLLPRYKELFKKDSEITKILNEIEANKEDPVKISELIDKFLSIKENAKKFFDTIAKSGDKELYETTIETFKKLGVNIPLYIPHEIYKVPSKNINGDKIKPEIIAQFPNARLQDIERRGDLVFYGDKVVNLKTLKAYISGENGYAIETNLVIPNTLDLKAKYQKERLRLIDEIETNKKILNLIENKMILQKELEKLKGKKSKERKNQDDLEFDIQINLIEKELQKINEKLKQAIPSYRLDQDELLMTFLKQKIEESTKDLKSLEGKFDEEIKRLLETEKNKIETYDQNVRDTINFLNDLGITNIKQSDLQKIIDRVNINPQNYGFSRKIDLKVGFIGSVNDVLRQKREFFNFFSRIYEKMNFNPPINEGVVDGSIKDPRLKESSLFKQKLEDAGITSGGNLQIETFFGIINKKSKENEKKEELTFSR